MEQQMPQGKFSVKCWSQITVQCFLPVFMQRFHAQVIHSAAPFQSQDMVEGLVLNFQQVLLFALNVVPAIFCKAPKLSVASLCPML